MKFFSREKPGKESISKDGRIIRARELRCGNCGKWRMTFSQDKYFAVNCDCTRAETGFSFRTKNY